MKFTSFPGCCTAKIIHDLGSTILSEGYTGNYGKKELKVWIESKLNNYTHIACSIVITNEEQKQVNEILRELKFKHSPWIEKEQHPETRIRIWWKKPTKG